jgi:hypothetical protein
VHREINDMFKKLFGWVPDRWLFNYAHAVVERRMGGQVRSTWIVLEIRARSLLAALRWNRGVSIEMRQQIARWI